MAAAAPLDSPVGPRSRLERPPANGPYEGPARVRVLPPGMDAEGLDGGPRLFGKKNKTAQRAGRKGRTSQLGVERMAKLASSRARGRRKGALPGKLRRCSACGDLGHRCDHCPKLKAAR